MTTAPAHLEYAVGADAHAERSMVLPACVLTLLMFGPLAFGAVEYWSLFALRSSAAVLLALWAVGQARTGHIRVRISPVLVPLALWGLLVCAQYVSGHTAYRYATFVGALNYLAYLVFCFLATQCFRSEERLSFLSAVVSCFGAAVACFAIVQGFTSNGRLYWLRVPQYGGSIYGPYLNHNHYAGLMEMLTPIPLVFCLSSALSLGKRVLSGSAALLMALSIFLSDSRGGMVAFLAELVFLFAFLWAKEPHDAARSGRQLLILCGVLMALSLGFGTEQMRTRIADLGHAYDNEVAGGRWTIYRDGLRMWAQKPLLGWGLGTFPTTFPQFRSVYSDLVVNQAHNDVLQVGIETGAVGFGLMSVFVALLYRCGLPEASLHKSVSSSITLAALISCSGLLMHSLTDFNLHIPANAAWFFFLAGVAGRPRSS